MYRYSNKVLVTVPFWIFLIFFGCKNPFFVPTGIQQVESNLSTPENALEQLKNAYEYKNIKLFEEVLYSKEEFRFYLNPNLGYVDSVLEHINKNQFEKVIIDKPVIFPVLDDSTYIYLTYNEEVNIHRNMFQKSDEIAFGTFSSYFTDYFDTVVIAGDSTYKDTIEAIIYLDRTKITIISEVFIDPYGNNKVQFEIAPQVFFMKKNNMGLWKIRMWFELDEVKRV